ncbi:MAG TPA: acetyl-CoA carboxylase biotin carboxyl carrier protein [Thermomicrobiales bacterium]|nr:acetyl-CoA carboxylase biotin carboxyl carrier protein [Thermomicrobiales bacterium]
MTDQDDQKTAPMSATDGVIDAVRELITMMSKGGINELDLSTGDVTIRLRGGAGAAAVPVAMAVPVQDSSVPMNVVVDESKLITAPMIGTYYSAPAPGEPPFVQIGDQVETGQVIGIIEAMKIMNEITADHAGFISEILVENAQPVEYGSPLLRVVEADALG